MLDGETSVPETWSKHRLVFFIGKEKIIEAGEELSHSHPMFGSILGKLCRYVAGMDLSSLYKKEILFSPKAIPSCPFASFSKKIGEENASIAYRLDGKTLRLEIHVPNGYRGILSIAPFEAKDVVFKGVKTKLSEGVFYKTFDL